MTTAAATRRAVAAVLLLAAVAGVVCAQMPTGFKVTLTQSGVNYATQVGLSILEQQLSTLKVPDISEKVGTPVGSFMVDLSQITVSGLKIPSADSKISTEGLDVAVSGVSAAVSLHWHYREDSWPHASDSGTADVSVTQTTISVNIKISENKGEPTIEATSDSVSIGNFDIKLHGGTAWLYNWLVGMFKGQLRDSIQDALKGAVVQVINTQGAQAVATIPIVEKIDNTAEINYELTGNPFFFTTYVTSSHLGEFFQISNPQNAPYTPAAMPNTVNTKMLQVFLSELTPLSAGYVYFVAGQMHSMVHAKDVPAQSPIQLNTTYWQQLVPQLYTQYPDMLMQLRLVATGPPTLDLQTTGGTGSLSGLVYVDVVFPNGSFVNAFVLDATGVSSGKIGLTGMRITGSLAFVNASMTLNSTSIGQFDVSTLQQMLEFLVTNGVLPMLNKYLANGIPIPVVQGLSLVSPEVDYFDGYAVISSDFTYKPPAQPHATTRLAQRREPHAPVVVSSSTLL